MQEFFAELSANIPATIMAALNLVTYFLVFLYRAKMSKTNSTLLLSMRDVLSHFNTQRTQNSTDHAAIDARLQRCEDTLRIMFEEGGFTDGTNGTEICDDAGDRSEPGENS